jgi:3-(3-hydroxy-phenyl)propionate hydroxylase
VQDAENLAWKLAAVLQGQAPDALLDSYASEREAAADENILHSTRSTDFITPKSEISRLFRDAVLQLARGHPFARTLVNSGRLSLPATLRESALNTIDDDSFAGRMVPGAAAMDAPLARPDGRRTWLLRELGGGFTALLFADTHGAALSADLQATLQGIAELAVLAIAPQAATNGPPNGAALIDAEGLAQQRYDLQPGSLVLLRPDHHVCARWRRPNADAVRRAVERALSRA